MTAEEPTHGTECYICLFVSNVQSRAPIKCLFSLYVAQREVQTRRANEGDVKCDVIRLPNTVAFGYVTEVVHFV